MKRGQFLRRFGIGVAAIVTTPKILEGISEQKEIPKDKTWGLSWAKKVYQKFKARHPELGDRCLDKEGNEWAVTGRENRNYGVRDGTQIILTPVSVKPNKYGQIPNKQRIPIAHFDGKFTITNHRQNKYETTRYISAN